MIMHGVFRLRARGSGIRHQTRLRAWMGIFPELACTRTVSRR